jgi:hypothetical protein
MIPLDELVAEADLIVVGTLYSADEDSEGIGKGYIRVEEIISGKATTIENRPLRVGDSLKIRWADNWACAAGMHMGRQGRKGVWLLDVEKDGTVGASYPGKFDEVEQLGEIRRLLHRVKSKPPIAVDVLQQEAASLISPVQTMEVVVADVSPFPDYSLARAAITLLLSAGLYWILYRSRFRIR